MFLHGLESYVFTRRDFKDTKDVKFIKEDLVLFIEDLKTRPGKDIWVCGGANLANQLIKKDLIDEYHISTIPVILGGGIRLFQENNLKIRLKLRESKEENGVVTNIYFKK